MIGKENGPKGHNSHRRSSNGAFYDKMSREEDVEYLYLKGMHNMIQISPVVATSFPAPLRHLVPGPVGREAPGDVHKD